MLLVVDFKTKFAISEESIDVKWININEAQKYNDQYAFMRMINKIKDLKLVH